MLNIFSKKDRMILRSDMWNLGFVTDDVADVIKSKHLNIQWMKHEYKDRWFADPYLLEVTDKQIVVLVEEFCYKIRKGRIAKLVVSRPDYVLQDMKIVLELPTHLSFPVIYEKDGQVYVMPENSKSGGINIYRYNAEKERLDLVHEVGHLPLTDATIVKFHSDEEFVFSTKLPNPNGNELEIYPFDSDSMKMDEKSLARIRFSSNIARNAGNAFYVGKQMYRPAQDCNQCYGNGLNIQQVDRVGDTIELTTVAEFHSDNPNYGLGYHTFNMKNGLIVVDGHRLRFPRMVKFLHVLSKLK